MKPVKLMRLLLQFLLYCIEHRLSANVREAAAYMISKQQSFDAFEQQTAIGGA